MSYVLNFRSSSYNLVYTVSVDNKVLDSKVDALPDIAKVNTKIATAQLKSVDGTYTASKETIITVSSLSTSYSSSTNTTTVTAVRREDTSSMVFSSNVASSDITAVETALKTSVKSGMHLQPILLIHAYIYVMLLCSAHI